MKKQTVLATLLLVFFNLTFPAHADFLGKAVTGMQALEGYRYPVSLFVPDSYNPAKIYPFLIAIPDVEQDPAKYIEEWKSVAQKKNMIVLVPSLKIRNEDVPYTTDEWLLGLKKDIQKQYRVDTNKIYLSGRKMGAQYAGYLGVKYPEEFSAVALLEDSWAGPFEKLVRYQKSAGGQRPFFAAISKKDEDLYKEAERVAYGMTRKGYPVYLEKAEPEAFGTRDFNKHVLDWLDEKSASWAQTISESGKSLKAKTKQAVKEFFEVK